MGWLCNEEDVSTEIDLNGASRETLLEIIETQQKVIAELRNRVEYLERIISSGGSAGGYARQQAELQAAWLRPSGEQKVPQAAASRFCT